MCVTKVDVKRIIKEGKKAERTLKRFTRKLSIEAKRNRQFMKKLLGN